MKIRHFLKAMVYCLWAMNNILAQNVGINTNTPEAPLHLKANSWIKNIFETQGTDLRSYIGSDNNGLTLSNNAFWNGSAWVYPTATNSLYLLLHRGNNRIEFRVRPDGGTQTNAMTIDGNSNVGVGGFLAIDQANGNTGVVDTHSLRFGFGSGEGIGSKRNAGGNQFGLDFYTNFSNRLSISQVGNIGIGTTSPTEKLEVNGSIKLGDSNTNTRGAIRFNAQKSDFEGYTGTEWRSFTESIGATAPEVNAPTNVSADALLGYAVAITDEFAFAGAPFDDIGPNANQGSVIIYRKHPVTSKWEFYQKLTHPTGAANDLFGHAVAFSHIFLAVGAPQRAVNGQLNAGQVSIFYRDINTGLFTILAGQDLSTADAGSQLGYTLDFKDRTLMIGAPFYDPGGKIDAGTVYITGYSQTNNNQYPAPTDFDFSLNSINRYTPADLQPGDRFGSVLKIIDVDGNTLNDALVAAPFHDPDAVNNAGAVYKVYLQAQVGSGNILAFSKITAPDKTTNDNFGIGLAGIKNNGRNFYAIGSKRENGAVIDQGRVYLYSSLDETPVFNTSFTHAGGVSGDKFGSSIEFINHQALLIGCPGEADGVINRYISKGLQNWVVDKKITDPNASPFQELGVSLALYNGNFISGASNANKVYLSSALY